MRNAARDHRIFGKAHAGLAYQALAPSGSDGKVPNLDKPTWFERVVKSKPHPDYEHSYNAWYNVTHALGHMAYVKTVSPLLLGVGEPSAVEVGLTIHPTWGVPYIPGSALKGLLSHYLMATYGPEKLGIHPSDPNHPEPERAAYQAVTWQGTKISHGPGEVYRAIFGAPTADSDDDYPETSGALVGQVTFHDALMKPLPEKDSPGPYLRDIVNPHVPSYYKDGHQGNQWPNDRESPIPVFYIAVRPQLEFRLAISGAPELQELTLQLLIEALRSWGVGAKTRAGYGRFSGSEENGEVRIIKPPAPTDPILEELVAMFDDEDLSKNDKLNAFETEFFERLKSKVAEGKQEIVAEACRLGRKVFKNKKRKDRFMVFNNELLN